jgi:hypothetical protein
MPRMPKIERYIPNKSALTEYDRENLFELAATVGRIISRLCHILIARGLITEDDHQYIAGNIDSDEWARRILS